MRPHGPVWRAKGTGGPLAVGTFHQPGTLMILPSIHRSAAEAALMFVNWLGATPNARPVTSRTGRKLQGSESEPSLLGVTHSESTIEVAARLPSFRWKTIMSTQDDARSITLASDHVESCVWFVEFCTSALVPTAVGAC